MRKNLNFLIGKCIFHHSHLIRDSQANDVIKEPFETAEAFNNYFIDNSKKLRDANNFQVKHKSDKNDKAQFTTLNRSVNPFF